jgi:hypothetical protein
MHGEWRHDDYTIAVQWEDLRLWICRANPVRFAGGCALLGARMIRFRVLSPPGAHRAAMELIMTICPAFVVASRSTFRGDGPEAPACRAGYYIMLQYTLIMFGIFTWSHPKFDVTILLWISTRARLVPRV